MYIGTYTTAQNALGTHVFENQVFRTPSLSLRKSIFLRCIFFTKIIAFFTNNDEKTVFNFALPYRHYKSLCFFFFYNNYGMTLFFMRGSIWFMYFVRYWVVR